MSDFTAEEMFARDPFDVSPKRASDPGPSIDVISVETSDGIGVLLAPITQEDEVKELIRRKRGEGRLWTYKTISVPKNDFPHLAGGNRVRVLRD